MNLRFFLLPMVLPFVLCSCSVYEVATAPDSDSRAMLIATDAICPIYVLTGTRAFEGPSEQTREKNLPDYIRTIRNRNLGKVTSDDIRITYMAMNYAYPILAKKSQKEVIDLLGPPDRVVVSHGRTGFIYNFKGGDEGPDGTVLYFETDRSAAK